MNRRNLLVSIGTAAVGTGAVLGSGALTSVEAERSVTIDVNEDSAALLGLSVGTASGVSNDGNGEIVIDLPENLNDEATTKFGSIDTSTDTVDPAALEVTNNGAENITASVTVNGTDSEILSFRTTDNNGGTTDLSSGITLEGSNNTGPETRKFIIVIDTSGDSNDYSSGVDITGVTFEAN